MAIQFDGQVVPSFVKIQDIEVGLLPRIEQATIEIRGRPGSFDFGNQVNDRKIVVTYSILADSSADLRKKAHIMAKWAYSDVPKKLVLLDDPEYFYWAKVTGTPELNEVYRVGSGTLEFRCTDPHAYGASRTQQIAGIPKVEKDIDTSAEFQDVINNTNLVMTNDSIILAREGSDYSKAVTNFSTGGTHTNTTGNSSQDLILASTSTPHNDEYQIDYLSGTFNGSIHDPFLNQLVMNNLPNFNSNVLDYMDAADTTNDWELYTDPTDSGATTFTQNSGYYTMNSLNMDGAIKRLTGTFTFPITIDFLYRLSPSNTSQTNPVRVDARVVYGGVMFVAQLLNTGGAWKMGRIVVQNATQADFYINGIRQGSLTAINSGLSNRIQFFTDQAWQCIFDLSYFGIVSEARTTYQQASYPFPTTATYTSSEIALDGTSDIYSTSTITFISTTGAIHSGFGSSLKVEVDVFKSGTWQGYQVVSSGESLPYLTNGDDLSGVKVRIRVTLSAYGVEDETPNITPISLSVDGQISSYFNNGSFVSNADMGIQQVGKASETSFTWNDEIPTGTTVNCLVSVDNGTTYQPVNKGDPIPNISSNTDLSTATL